MALHRLYDGSTTAHTVAHTIVRTNGSASSLRAALHRLYERFCNGSTALHRLYERLCIVSTNDPTNGSTMALHRLCERLYERPYERPHERLCNGSTTALRTAL